MKLSPQEQEQLTALLTRIYQELSDIETEYHLLSGEGDFRPRIEYFHDAVRAFFSGDKKALEVGGRLNVEWLAYDLKCLRFLQSKPLSSFKPHGELLSPKTDLVAITQAPVVTQKRPDRTTRERMAELYQNYAVLFAALLKPFADKDFLDRTDALNQDIAEINAVLQELGQFTKNKGSLENLAAAANHMEDPELRHLITQFLQKGGGKRPADIHKLMQKLKEEKTRRDKLHHHIDKAHMDYAMNQLAVYEESKDMLKSLAGKGMNLVGKFVESAMAQTRREMGR